MSENAQNQKVVVVANLKSPVIGFVLALFLGWLGVDRFYKGGVNSIVAGIIKLICGLTLVIGKFLFVFVFFLDNNLQTFIFTAIVVYAIWYILDLILVPLGISLDNRKKLAMAQGSKVQENAIVKGIDKGLSTIIRVALVIVIILAVLAFLFLF